MSSRGGIFTVSNLNAIFKKDGIKCMTINTDDIRDLKTINPKNPNDTTYFSVCINGVKLVSITFDTTVIASGAKPPKVTDSNKNPAYMFIGYQYLSPEKLASGDYKPKTKDTQEAQALENKKKNALIDSFGKNNAEMLELLEFLNTGWLKICSDLKENDKPPFKISKNRGEKASDVKVSSFKQSTRINDKTNEDEQLEYPIYRGKLNINKDGKIGKTYREFTHIVFDARKLTTKNKKLQPAMIERKVESEDDPDAPPKIVSEELTYLNVGEFITYLSIASGELTFEGVSSKFGLSTALNFKKLVIFKHSASKVKESSDEEINKYRGGISDDEEDEKESHPKIENLSLEYDSE